MLPEQAIEISKVRFDHAKECLRDAKLLLAGESYRSAANRAYYAIFHAMRAVLALDGRYEAPQRNHFRVPETVYQNRRV